MVEQFVDIKKKVNMNKEIKAVFIDWNGTLSSSKFFEDLENSQPEVYSGIQETLFGGELTHLLNPWMMGEIETEEVIHQLGNQLGINQEELLDHFIRSCRNMIIVNSALDLIHQIRQKGVQVVIATDNMDSFNRWTIPSLKLTEHFDAILNSATLNTRKKDINDDGVSLFFEEYLMLNGFKPEETVLIDDSEDKGGTLSAYGINYRKINFGEGLEEELKDILQIITRPQANSRTMTSEEDSN